jgi:hypothetical protein
MFYKIVKPKINLELLKYDIILNSHHVKSEFNKRILWLESDTTLKIIEIILQNLEKETLEDFQVYVKNTFAYIQEQELDQEIKFDKQLKRGINPKSKYSFILFIKSFKSKISLRLKNEIKEIVLEDGDLLIFKTEDFLCDEFSTPERIGIYGSLTNEIDQIKIYKNLI